MAFAIRKYVNKKSLDWSIKKNKNSAIDETNIKCVECEFQVCICRNWLGARKTSERAYRNALWKS